MARATGPAACLPNWPESGSPARQVDRSAEAGGAAAAAARRVALT